MVRSVTYGFLLRCAKALAFIPAFACVASAQQADDRTHVLALGDSLTQGYGLMEQDGFVPQLRDWLNERGHAVRVVNGGVSGDTTAGGLARVEWSLSPEIDAMIVALGGNDLLRGIAPETARGNLDGILRVAEARDVEVLLVGMQAPGNYGRDYKQAFDSIYPELAVVHDTLYVQSFLGPLTDGGGMNQAARYMQPDGIHPNAEGVARIVDTIGPAVEKLVARARE
jgi:acyl-CoA thioesterase-1